jgi:hypothetical protein
MKTRFLLTALAAFSLGMVLGGILWWRPRHRGESGHTIPMTNSLVSLLPSEEVGKSTDWIEYKKADWHVALLWVHDPVKAEAVVYVFRRDSMKAWKLQQSDKVRYAEGRLDQVDIVYPERYAMLIDSEGVLIKTMVLGDEGESEGEGTGENAPSREATVFRTNDVR